MPLSAAERQRRCREKRKNNPEKVAEVKRKDLERYHARKKLVKDMTLREHRAIKRKWRIRNKKRREKQKALQNILLNTPASTPPPSPRLVPLSPRSRSLTPASTASSRGRKIVRRDRSKLYRENVKLHSKIQELQRKIFKYKKRLHRYGKKKEYKDSTGEETTKSKKYDILSNAVKEHYMKIKDHKTKRNIKSMFQSSSIKKSGLKLQLLKENLGIKRDKKYKTIRSKETLLQCKIRNFFLRDDVSRATAGRKETVTLRKVKVQKRILLDTLKNLYQSFIKENPDFKCHYSYFSKHKPFYVVPPSVDGRDTCLCKLHANMRYITISLYKNKIIRSYDMNQIIPETVCDVNLLACMNGTCTKCQNKQLKYDVVDPEKTVEIEQWTRNSEIIIKNGRKVKISKNIKTTENLTISALIKKFKDLFKTFKVHIFNIKNQYRCYRQCIDELTEKEIVLHIDFSENYACKYHEEIQSVHFGASRNQVTLHTAVLYHRSLTGGKHVRSFCTVSSDLNHGPAAIWAHLHPIFDFVQKELPHVTIVHIFSDGPCTQYKQKNNFYLMSTTFFEKYTFESLIWNFFESGHGKGAADGVGGSLKRLADNLVATGRDIVDAFQFFEALKDRSRTTLFFISKDDVAQIQMQITHEILPLKGTMQVHQIFAQQPGILSYRILSCYCSKFCSCYGLKTYRPLLEEVVDLDKLSSDVEEPFADITNIVRGAGKGFYNTVYNSSTSEEEDHQPLVNLRRSLDIVPSTSYDITKEKIHPSLIKDGTHLLVKIVSDRKKEYTYLGVAKSDVDEEGEVRINFYRTVDDSGKKFKLVEGDISDVTFDDLIKIVPPPTKVKRGRRVIYEFDHPLEVFEK